MDGVQALPAPGEAVTWRTSSPALEVIPGQLVHSLQCTRPLPYMHAGFAGLAMHVCCTDASPTSRAKDEGRTLHAVEGLGVICQ